MNAQPDRWQQRIKYAIDVNMNVATNRFDATEQIDYWNNSPDTLNRIFFHLYWNAFQPGSMMDVRSRELGKIIIGTDKNGKEIGDWDPRVRDRILNLKPNEIGYDSVGFVKINGVSQKLIYHETILEVKLSTPILPHSKTTLAMAFRAQVPLQVRRSGRDNVEGVRYSMSQWYPKMVEYDYQGWNANPYVAREFYGVWGDYNVNITIDKNYLLAGTGTVQNTEGYEQLAMSHEQLENRNQQSEIGHQASTFTWKFAAQNVHDFVWAADTSYTLIKQQVKDGPMLYVVYKKRDSAMNIKWQHVLDTAVIAYPYIAKTFGIYPYKNYSFIQGGDGGMEYPMATLLRGPGIDGAIHEWLHSWYQGMLGTNESLYPWMDEGFTTYAEKRVLAHIRKDTLFAWRDPYKAYLRLTQSGKEEPMSTHADHYNTNFAYGNAAYYKGCIFLSQLGYIVGENVLDNILHEYYNQWRFKHPNPNDFVRVAEKASGIELQWYKEYWVNSTKTIDYALGSINDSDGNAAITLKRIGYMPMPIDVLVTYKNGSKEMHYVPLELMYGSKASEDKNIPFIMHAEWPWTNPEYTLLLTKPVSEIKEIEIDPSMRMADVNRVNNKIVVP